MKTLRLLLLKSALLAFAALSPIAVHAIGAAGDTEWPAGATLDIRLKLTATLDNEGHPKVAGDLVITNPGGAALTIQEPTNRLVLAFLVFDELGNPLAPKLVGKSDPAFTTHSLAPHATFTHHFEGLDFVTGSVHQSYELSRGKRYRIIAVYRAAGPRGPGFTSRETEVQIPK